MRDGTPLDLDEDGGIEMDLNPIISHRNLEVSFFYNLLFYLVY